MFDGTSHFLLITDHRAIGKFTSDVYDKSDVWKLNVHRLCVHVKNDNYGVFGTPLCTLARLNRANQLLEFDKSHVLTIWFFNWYVNLLIAFL